MLLLFSLFISAFFWSLSLQDWWSWGPGGWLSLWFWRRTWWIKSIFFFFLNMACYVRVFWIISDLWLWWFEPFVLLFCRFCHLWHSFVGLVWLILLVSLLVSFVIFDLSLQIKWGSHALSLWASISKRHFAYRLLIVLFFDYVCFIKLIGTGLLSIVLFLSGQ